MDSRGGGREGEGNCFQVVRRRGIKRPLYVSCWMMRVLRGVACHTGMAREEFCATGKHHYSIVAASPLLHPPCSQGPLSPVNIRLKSDGVTCCASFCMSSKMKEFYVNPLARWDGSVMEALDDRFEQISVDGASSSISVDNRSSETLSFSFGDLSCDHGQSEDSASSSDGSSPLRWPLNRNEKCSSGIPLRGSKSTMANYGVVWEEKGEKREIERLEFEMMKERFAKLLLGEDMSGGGKGVCTALAISNAITNLSASVLGELWRLEPLSSERKTMWRREMECLLSVADYVVELVPSWQNIPDGSMLEVMVSRPRSDLQINLPALQKLDTMLVESLDSFNETEFWYVDQGIMLAEDDNQYIQKLPLSRQEDKWWLPSPEVPVNGLSDEARKRLQHKRDWISQILKAAMAINNQILSEMEVPHAYWEALPKNGKASLGESTYRHITSECFSPEAFLSSIDLTTEHNALELTNRIEAAIHVWRRKKQWKHTLASAKDSRLNAKTSWGIVKDLVVDMDRRELLAGRAESLLLCVKQRFPGLPQTLLDIMKIQYNRDVGQSILESYSRVMETLAFNIMARIDDVLYVDDLAKRVPPLPLAVQTHQASSAQKRGFSIPYATPHVTPTVSPTPSSSPRKTPNSPFHRDTNPHDMVRYFGKALSDFMGLENSYRIEGIQDYQKEKQLQENKTWSDGNQLDGKRNANPPRER